MKLNTKDQPNDTSAEKSGHHILKLNICKKLKVLRKRHLKIFQRSFKVSSCQLFVFFANLDLDLNLFLQRGKVKAGIFSSISSSCREFQKPLIKMVTKLEK